MAGALSNVTASLSSFKINNAESYLHNVTGDYSRPSILDGGESFENTLLYTFNVRGLSGYTIDYVRFGVLLLTANGDLNSAKNYTITASKNNQQIGSSISATLPASSASETIIQLDFHPNNFEEETGDVTLALQTEPTNDSCYFGLCYVIISLQGIDKELKITFNGPSKQRNASSMTCGILVITKGSVAVTFSKDNTTNFNLQNDNVEGRIYYKKDGIYIDGYQYGVNAPATGVIAGIVRLQDEFERDENQEIIAPVEGGIAASPLLVYGVLQEAIRVANTEHYGRVKLRNAFLIDENDGGIVAPVEDVGVAASSQLVFNTLATAKGYTDEVAAGINDTVSGIQATLDGINAPFDVKFINDEDEEEIVGASLTFSDDFEFTKDTDKKLYIKWLEIS